MFTIIGGDFIPNIITIGGFVVVLLPFTMMHEFKTRNIFEVKLDRKLRIFRFII